jgi:hypothetical protein
MMSARLAAPTCCRAGVLLLALLSAPRAQALLRFNDSRDQIYVTAYIGAGYDSNIFSRGDGSNGDMYITGGAGLEYARKAGLIGVNASLGWDFGSFDTFSDEDFVNPNMSLEFSKGTGRTTGAVQFNARRNTQADPSVGLRTDSWNYGVNLNYRYPVIERYSVAGNIGWSRIDYSDNSGTFADLDTFTIGTDLFYSWRSDRDLLTGYRYRISETTESTHSNDHSVYVGVSGRIVSKLSGTARVGWTFRTNEFDAGFAEESYDGFYMSVSSTWPATKKITVTLAATQDFSVTSTNFQTETTSVDLTGQFSHTVKWNTNVTLGGGYTSYISGFVDNTPSYSDGFNGQDRDDHYFTFGVTTSYALTSHLTVSASYNYFRNWSTLSRFEFYRHSVGITLSARW